MSDSHVKESLRIVKVGGSLLDLPDLDVRLREWLANQPELKTVWVVGGGKLADEVRRLETEGIVNSEQAHWMAIEAMESNSKLLSACFAEWELVQALEEIEVETPRNLIFLSGDWLRATNELPHNWSVTSDSIAAALGVELGAEEVVLLKSRLAKTDSIEEAAQCGIVDLHFPMVARGISTRIVNLRSATFDDKIFVAVSEPKRKQPGKVSRAK